MAEEGRRLSQGTCSGEMLLSTKPGWKRGVNWGCMLCSGKLSKGHSCRNKNDCVVPHQVAFYVTNKPMEFRAPANGVKYTVGKATQVAVAVGGVKSKMCFQFLWYVHWSYEAQENHLELHIWTAHVSHKEIVIIGIIMF